MTKNPFSLKEISFRPAKASDAKLASRLLFESFSQKATFIIGLGSEKRAKKILVSIFPQPGHRLSYEFTQMAVLEGRVVGLIIAFPGKAFGRLNRKLNWLVLKHYKFRGKLALIIRALPLIFLKETGRDEFFLSNLVVKQAYRHRGIGKEILNYVEAQARQGGFSKIALIVNLDNHAAKKLYDQHGYGVRAINLESNRRVPYLGPGNQRRVKELNI
jgi:ribosomal protein S18 acetylase RimI-like enzyme